LFISKNWPCAEEICSFDKIIMLLRCLPNLSPSTRWQNFVSPFGGSLWPSLHLPLIQEDNSLSPIPFFSDTTTPYRTMKASHWEKKSLKSSTKIIEDFTSRIEELLLGSWRRQRKKEDLHKCLESGHREQLKEWFNCDRESVQKL